MTDEERQHLQEAWCKCYDAMKDAFEKIAEQMKPVFDAIGKAADLIEAQKKFEFEMTPEEAIEELQNVLNGEIAEYGEEGCEYTEKAFEMAIEALNERDKLHEQLKIMQHRCVCLTNGHLCKYCVYVDCEYKEQEE